MAKFKTTPQTPKDDLLQKEATIPKAAGQAKKASAAAASTTKPARAPQKGKQGWGIGIGGCFLGACSGIIITIAIVIGGLIFAGQVLLKNLPPELVRQLSSQEGISEFLDSLQSGEGFRILFEEDFEEGSSPFPLPIPKEFEESSPSSSPSAQPTHFPFKSTP